MAVLAKPPCSDSRRTSARWHRPALAACRAYRRAAGPVRWSYLDPAAAGCARAYRLHAAAGLRLGIANRFGGVNRIGDDLYRLPFELGRVHLSVDHRPDIDKRHVDHARIVVREIDQFGINLVVSSVDFINAGVAKIQL